ncbi:MAG: saccharopine dehydrogenase [Deltaproteobacteria bacterium]|nr:saccharopine dehydrogenase [Deltaproteobacteria bacterium]
MAKVIVLGAGRVGRVIARDIAEDGNIEVTVSDNRAEYLASLAKRYGFNTLCDDLSKPETIKKIVADFDLVVGALPGFIGLQTMEAVIAAKKPYVDISFMPEDPRFLGKAAKEAGISVLYDIGVAPGISNLLIAHGVRELATAKYVRYVVGGLPVIRTLPWEYEAPFSPIDVIEEYTRPARFKMGGEMMERPALSDMENFDIPGVGTLEGFLTDGLRSLIDTIDCPNMEEKTLRYPGHGGRIKTLLDGGFLDDRELDVGGAKVNIRDFTFKLLEPAWYQEEDSEEFTAMQILVVGGGENERRITWNLLDRTDRERGETSMARTTGFPAAISVRRFLDGTINLEPGVHPPEALGSNDAFVKGMLDDLAARGVIYSREDS